LKKKKKK